MGYEELAASALLHPATQSVIFVISVASIVVSVENLNSNVKKTLNHPVFKSVLMFLVVLITFEDIQLAGMFSVGYLALSVTFMLLNKESMFDLISPTTDVKPECTKVTVQDLMNLYKGDVKALKEAMYDHGVPLNLELNDYNAPLIATYIVHRIPEACALK